VRVPEGEAGEEQSIAGRLGERDSLSAVQCSVGVRARVGVARTDSIQHTVDSRQAAGSRQQAAGSRQQTADIRQQTADSRQEAADSRQI
jgi:hypothetical protein